MWGVAPVTGPGDKAGAAEGSACLPRLLTGPQRGDVETARGCLGRGSLSVEASPGPRFTRYPDSGR
jgi:hypothetical protein